MADTLGDDLVKDALEAGATRAAIADTSELVFHEEYRKACEKNSCGRYATNWMGPPAIGSIDELAEKARNYKQGLLFQTVCPIEDSTDWDGMMAGSLVHEQVLRNLLARLRGKYKFKSLLPLNARCCSLCERCAYLDGQPCRHPDIAVSPVEAYGIDVMALAKSAGLPYYNGKNTVSFMGLILFE